MEIIKPDLWTRPFTSNNVEQWLMSRHFLPLQFPPGRVWTSVPAECVHLSVSGHAWTSVGFRQRCQAVSF